MDAGGNFLDDLVVRTALGDAGAFSDLYTAASPRLLAVSIRVLGQRCLAEEALHDSFMKIWAHAGRYRREDGPALAWMATIVRNHSVDMVRRPRERSDADEALVAQLADPGPSPESMAVAQDASRRLCACMERLLPVHRQALSLAYAHDMSHAEVARHLGRPVGTVKTHIRRGIVLLRRCMLERAAS